MFEYKIKVSVYNWAVIVIINIGRYVSSSRNTE